MRIGPWILGAGLALLAAGVASTRADAWDTRIPALTIPLAMDGIDTVDLRGSGIEKVVISDRGTAQVRYPEGRRFAWQDTDQQATPPSCRATAGTLRCKAGTQFLPGEPTMQLPPRRYRLLADDATIRANSDLQSVTIEMTGQVSWTGPVEVLDVSLSPRPKTGTGEDYCSPPRFTFDGGRVGNLRIHAGAGSLDLDHLSEVGNIEVRAVPDVGLAVGRLADIARIKVFPLVETPGLNASGDDGARGTCGDAMRAAASAEMD